MATLGKGLESLIPPKRISDPAQSGGVSQHGLGHVSAPTDDGRGNDDDALMTSDISLDALDEGVTAQEIIATDESEAAEESAISHTDFAEEFSPAPAPIEHEVPASVVPQKTSPIHAVSSTRSEKPSSARKKPKEDMAIFYIEVEKIRPNKEQPRRNFDEEGIKELAASIREFGILQPLVVRKIEHEVPTGTEVEYELIAGERRWLASQMLGLERVPAVVRNVDLERERLELAVIENLQREDLNPVEMARAFARLQDEFRMTQREIASRLGKSRETVANTLRLLDLPPDVQKALEERRVSESHGRLLLTIDDPGLQMKLFHDLLSAPMTTRELRNKVRGARRESGEAEEKEEIATPELSPELAMLQERLSQELGAPVKIQQHGSTGKITITFYSNEELQNIMSRFRVQGEE